MANYDIWVFCESRKGQLNRVSAEILGKAVDLNKSLNAKVAAVIIGDKVDLLSSKAAAYGADKVYTVNNSKLKYYENEAYAYIMADLIKKYSPDIVLFGSTEIGDDLAPRTAAKLGTGLTSHCVDLRIEESQGSPLLFQTVPAWGGSKRIDIICPFARPQMATVKSGVFDMPAERNGSYEEIHHEVALPKELFRSRVVEEIDDPSCEESFDNADVVVAAGWGVCAAGVIEKAKELNEIVRGTMGATRPVTDKNIMPENRMIGQSGKIVNPKLFISLGASGATHFTTGFEKSQYIIAINKDPRAAIFDVCDIGLVGDLNKILPLLTDEIKKIRDH